MHGCNGYTWMLHCIGYGCHEDNGCNGYGGCNGYNSLFPTRWAGSEGVDGRTYGRTTGGRTDGAPKVLSNNENLAFFSIFGGVLRTVAKNQKNA